MNNKKNPKIKETQNRVEQPWKNAKLETLNQKNLKTEDLESQIHYHRSNHKNPEQKRTINRRSTQNSTSSAFIEPEP